MNGPSLADIEKARDIALETTNPKWLLLAVRPENTQIAKENFFCVPLPEKPGLITIKTNHHGTRR